MGATYSIEYVRKDSGNADYARTYDELPSRFETNTYWIEGKGSYPIGLAFQCVFDKVNPNSNKLLSFLKIKAEYLNDIVDKLNQIDDYENAYHNKKYYLDLVYDIMQIMQNNPQFDFYFCWK